LGLKKLESWGYPVVKTRDLTVISFELIPACIGRTDMTPPMPVSRPSIAERDNQPITSH